jgi:hypothetical protein
MRRVFDNYTKKAIQKMHIPAKLKHKKQCMLNKEPVKTEDADKEDSEGQAEDKPTKVKSVAWVLRGTAKAMPRMMPVRSTWRIWDPGRSEAHVVLRGVIVRNKHDWIPARHHALYHIQRVYVYVS